MARFFLPLLMLLSATILSFCVGNENQELLLVTVATDENDGLRRYLRSTKKYDLKTKVFGLGTEWRGGDMTDVGGGHKINILKENLAQYKDREDLILMFTDSYDVVITAGAEEILEKFKKFDARVVFSAEGFCWPDSSLASSYPDVKLHEKKYLCSGGFIGYARDVYQIISHNAAADTDDDQLYYTKIFLDKALREKWNIKLDKRSEIFMNLHGALGDIMLKFKGQHSFLYNVKTGTVPIVIHGNGPIKPEFNRLANYLADSWTTSSGCMACEEDTISLEGMQEDDYPTILMGIFVEQPTPFVKEALLKVAALDYPKQKINVLIHNSVENHNKDVEPFLTQFGKLYKSVNTIDSTVDEKTARNSAVEECMKKDCQYYFNVDGDVHLENDQALKLLIQQNRSVLAPMLTRKGKAWSNFWGALSATGFYARSEDYMEIVNGDKIGVWNVPYITGAYLVQGHVLPSIQNGYDSSDLDADMALCKTLREGTKKKGLREIQLLHQFMFITNKNYFGFLIDTDNVQTNRLNVELWEIFSNPEEWAQRYIHPNYSQSLKEHAGIEQPCPDVFWFPVLTEEFCDELVAEMEYYGGWSGGKSEDSRLAGGYENVPTDDIHMTQINLQNHWLEFLRVYVAPLATAVYPGYYSNDSRLSSGYENVPTDDVHMTQVGLQEHWIEFLRKYVTPLQLKVYPGFHEDPPRAILNFVVKYNPARQRELRPHHDSSTFTINIALNHPKIDYEGGGCRFLRYNCSVTDTRKGWMLMHPGRLTHYHEGLPTTRGTRYIFVSFVDP